MVAIDDDFAFGDVGDCVDAIPIVVPAFSAVALELHADFDLGQNALLCFDSHQVRTVITECQQPRARYWAASLRRAFYADIGKSGRCWCIAPLRVLAGCFSRPIYSRWRDATTSNRGSCSANGHGGQCSRGRFANRISRTFPADVGHYWCTASICTWHPATICCAVSRSSPTHGSTISW